ncbi:MAG: hypothetical protein DRJ38_03725 [Thermoprotei archaeon]|nr:MAG: hypothetical protein DRJ38_03725 [Thermoprotei archaeon]
MTSNNDIDAAKNEIIIFNMGKGCVFDFPVEFYNRYLKGKIKLINPKILYRGEKISSLGRVRLFVDPEKASELKVWLAILLSENEKYFLTEIEMP